MPDLFDLFLRWWKRIFLLVVITVVTTAIIVFLIPKKYLGVTTALPAPAYAADRTGVFSQDLRELYSALGTPDDLDMILGTAHLDTVYIAVAKQLNLAEHYHIKNDDASGRRAACFLKRKTKVIKTDYGELQVKVWDIDKNLAADMANAIMEKFQQIHQDVQTANNAMMLSKINDEYAQKKIDYQKLHDSLNHMDGSGAAAQILAVQQTSLIQQIQEYGKLANQYKLMVDAKPRALIIVEKATPALKADRPKALQIIIAAAVLSFFFGLLSSLVLERRRITKR